VSYREEYIEKYNRIKSIINEADGIVLYGNSVVSCIIKTAVKELGINKPCAVFNNGKFLDPSLSFAGNNVVILCSVRKETRLSMIEDSKIYFDNCPIFDFFPIYYVWIVDLIKREVDSDIFAETLFLCEKEETIPNIDSINTVFCNLRCKECSNGIQYRKEKYSIPVESQIYHLNRITEKLAITQCNFQGGEVFIDKNFGRYLVEHAKNPRVAILTIATNGTILPSDDLFRIIKGIGAMIRISDYGDLSKKKNELIEKCNVFGIPCFIFPMAEKWRKFGDYYSRGRSETELRNICKECCFGTHDLMFLNDKLFCCLRTLYGSVVGENESVKLNTLNLDEDFSADYLKRFCSGENLWRMCDYCDFPMEIIEPAEQM